MMPHVSLRTHQAPMQLPELAPTFAPVQYDFLIKLLLIGDSGEAASEASHEACLLSHPYAHLPIRSPVRLAMPP